ncbi:TetR/AcrR family transcriptional regulator [Nocardioides sambongensis]|uniref:TetR/AcrR family transcriptional regulator n=1 Tax=Nocardioides sambongensis TaxID=2589074 RepID=UPI00112E23CB|nr:TetR/AcrR family transcriptional regulator [Nocardioides sambongensis]
MPSLRHNQATGGEQPGSDTAAPSPRDGYLDAARACILDVGWRRTTLTEVARRSGVSRMTIYRAWPDMQTLLGDLMTREWTELVTAGAGPLSAADPATTSPPSPQTVAAAVTSTVEALRDNELFTRIVELDPELILPYLLSRRGRSQEAVLDALGAVIAAGQRAGTLRAGDATAIARGLVLSAHGFVLSAQTMTDDDLDLTALLAELHAVVVRSLAP